MRRTEYCIRDKPWASSFCGCESMQDGVEASLESEEGRDMKGGVFMIDWMR